MKIQISYAHNERSFFRRASVSGNRKIESRGRNGNETFHLTCVRLPSHFVYDGERIEYTLFMDSLFLFPQRNHQFIFLQLFRLDNRFRGIRKDQPNTKNIPNAQKISVYSTFFGI